MYKNILQNIDNIAIWPIISFVIFFIFFLCLMLWVGIAVSDDNGVFTPACDGILAGEEITSLDKMLHFAKSSSTILKTGFAISFFYNAITLSIAVSGNLTPLVAAILMPISSISVVGFCVMAVNFSGSRHKM